MSAPAPHLLLRPTAAVVGGALLHGVAIRVADGRVTAVGADLVARPGEIERTIDGTLLPGLVDLQVNGMGGRGCQEGSSEALDAVARTARAGGAAAFLPTLITAPLDDLAERARAVAAWIERGGPADGATPLGIHLEGPFLELSGAHDEALFVDPTPERVDRLLDACRGHLELVTLAPGRPGAAAATRRLAAAGVTVSIGHATRTAGFDDCVAAGARLVTHLFNAMSPLHHRDLGIVGRALDEPALACCLIADGHHVDPAALRIAWRALGRERTVLVTDAMDAAGMPDGDYALSGMPVTVRAGVVRDRAGRLAGSVLTMADAVRFFLAHVPGSDLVDVAAIAAVNPANAIGAVERAGIAPGAVAVFTRVGGDGRIEVLDAAHAA